jgi:hypothetical protein
MMLTACTSLERINVTGNQAAETLRSSENVLFQAFGGESVLLNIAREKYYGLDDVGTNMWHLITELGSRDAVLARLCHHYDADRDTLDRDLNRLIALLLAEGLLCTDPASENPAG